MSEQKKHIVASLIQEVWGGGDLSRLEQLVDSDIVANVGSERQAIVGLSAYRELVAAYQMLIGAIEFTIEEQLIDGDKVVSRWTARRSQDAGTPGVMGISIHRVTDDRIAEAWDAWDMLSVLETDDGDDIERPGLNP